MSRRSDNVVPFRALPLRRRASRPPRFPRPRRRWGEALGNARPFLLLAVLVTLWVVYEEPELMEPPAFMQTAPERIEGSFTDCGPGRGYYCVIDGDTFKIGERSVRVSGIDAPEIHAQCSAEAEGAARATAALRLWLNNGPFRMSARVDEPTDKYGRELRIVKRLNPDGSEDRLADRMREGGFARGYFGAARGGWC